MEQMTNAAACLFEVGQQDHVAIECGSRRATYGELRQAVARGASVWKSQGLTTDDRVVVFAPDSIAWVEAYLAVIWAGGVAIGVNPRLGMSDLAPILAESGVRFVWTTAESVPQLVALTKTMQTPPRIVADAASCINCIEWQAACRDAKEIPPMPRAPGDMALWIGTSGTTGTPKGVVHTQSVTASCAAFAREILGASRTDRLYATSKLFFAYALANSLFAGLRLGACVILDTEWPTAERVAEMVERHRPTIMFCVPTLYHKMIQAGVATQLAGSGIRHFVSAGESLPAKVFESWQSAAGVAPISGYGTSESLCLMLYADNSAGSLRPTPLTQVRFDDLPEDVPQRIWFRHPSIARGYWQRPKENAECFRDAWFSPGDMFIRHRDRLEFTGRNDDMLKIAGQWVSTQWVEQALKSSCGEAIQDVAAVAVRNDDGLSEIAVFLVAAPQQRESDLRLSLAKGIALLPGHKRPRWTHWVDALPLTATGKLQRSRLGEIHKMVASRTASSAPQESGVRTA